MTSASQVTPGAVRSLIPARIDRLPWSLFHPRMVAAIGLIATVYLLGEVVGALFFG